MSYCFLCWGTCWLMYVQKGGSTRRRVIRARRSRVRVMCLSKTRCMMSYAAWDQWVLLHRRLKHGSHPWTLVLLYWYVEA